MFSREHARLLSIAPMIDAGAQTGFPIRVACLFAGGGEVWLEQAVFHEVRSDAGQMELASFTRIGGPKLGATTALAIWTNEDRFRVPVARFGWQAGHTFTVESIPKGAPARVELPTHPTQIVRPALMPLSGDVDLFSVDSNDNLYLSRFPVDGPGRVVWTAPMDAPVRESRAAMGPPESGDRHAALLVLETNGHPALVLVECDGDKPMTRRLDLPSVRLLRHAEPALWIGTDGSVSATALFRAKYDPSELFVADVSWPARRGEPSLRLTEAQMATDIVAGAATYSVARGPTRRDWAVVLEDGSIASNRFPGQTRRMKGKPAMPLVVLAMSQVTYVLTIAPRGGLAFEPLS